MIFVVPTVEHSGTHFIVHHLLRNYPVGTLDQIQDTKDVVYFGHMGQKKYKWDKMMDVMLDRECAIITPLRSLERIVVSWERRRKDLKCLEKELEILVDIIDPLDPFYLPIDADNRDLYLNDINDYLGLHLKTDWPVVSSDKSSYNTTEQHIKDKEIYKRFKEKFEAFFSDFYGRN